MPLFFREEFSATIFDYFFFFFLFFLCQPKHFPVHWLLEFDFVWWLASRENLCPPSRFGLQDLKEEVPEKMDSSVVGPTVTCLTFTVEDFLVFKGLVARQLLPKAKIYMVDHRMKSVVATMCVCQSDLGFLLQGYGPRSWLIFFFFCPSSHYITLWMG